MLRRPPGSSGTRTVTTIVASCTSIPAPRAITRSIAHSSRGPQERGLDDSARRARGNTVGFRTLPRQTLPGLTGTRTLSRRPRTTAVDYTPFSCCGVTAGHEALCANSLSAASARDLRAARPTYEVVGEQP